MELWKREESTLGDSPEQQANDGAIRGSVGISNLPYRSGGQVTDSHTKPVNSSSRALASLSFDAVEALGEPFVNLRQHRALAAAHIAP